MTFCNRIFSFSFIAWFAVAQALCAVAPAYAQQSGAGIDLEPPLIEHEVVSEIASDIRQTFLATVVDDDELDSVRLFYRFDGDPSYSSTRMNRVSFSSSYMAQISTDPTSDTPIEYYIQARDKSGNRTMRGYAFSPLVRSFVVDEALLATTTPVTEAAPAPQQWYKKKNTLYVALGVVALGVLAGSAGGSGEPSNLDPGDTNCAPGGCNVIITIDQPVVTQ